MHPGGPAARRACRLAKATALQCRFGTGDRKEAAWLNDMTCKDSYPLLCIDHVLEHVAGTACFSSLGLAGTGMSNLPLKGNSTDPAKISMVKEWHTLATLANVLQLRTFTAWFSSLGLAGTSKSNLPLKRDPKLGSLSVKVMAILAYALQSMNAPGTFERLIIPPICRCSP